MTTMSTPQESALVCDLSAITPTDLPSHLTTTTALLASVSEVRELPDGYAFRLPDQATSLRQAAEFIAHERLCCSFFTFTLEVEPEHGPIWLRLTGPEGVKALLAAEMGPHLTPMVAQAAGFTVKVAPTAQGGA